jgi:hypothetical protein
MMILRLLCLAAGALVLVAPAVVLPAGAMLPDAGKAAAILICLVLTACAFLFTGMAGHLLRRSHALRSLAALLLAVPLTASAALLWRGAAPSMLWVAGGALGFTVTLYLTLVYPVLRVRMPALPQWRATHARRLVSRPQG